MIFSFWRFHSWLFFWGYPHICNREDSDTELALISCYLLDPGVGDGNPVALRG